MVAIVRFGAAWNNRAARKASLRLTQSDQEWELTETGAAEVSGERLGLACRADSKAALRHPTGQCRMQSPAVSLRFWLQTGKLLEILPKLEVEPLPGLCALSAPSKSTSAREGVHRLGGKGI